MFKTLFLQHPASVGESYVEHLLNAASFSALLTLAAIMCAVHALFPFLFEKTASSLVRRLHDRMVAHRTCERR